MNYWLDPCKTGSTGIYKEDFIMGLVLRYNKVLYLHIVAQLPGIMRYIIIIYAPPLVSRFFPEVVAVDFLHCGLDGYF